MIIYHKYKEKLSHCNPATLFCVAILAIFTACSTPHKITYADSGSIGRQPTGSDRRTGTTLRDGTAQRKIYIATYADVAVRNRKKYGIPAARTLGQGILESAGGTSDLAVNGNNHFGIKASSDWSGRTICKPGETVRYRKYASVEQCFADHAKFLSRKRYAPLFRLKTTDYKGWARQLKACGYATDPAYADKLIKIIETYGLQVYDR